MLYLYKKELAAYYNGCYGFIFMGIFLLVSGLVFTTYNLVGGNGDLNGMFGLLSNISFMTYPVLTMRMFAEERRAGTEQLLLTSRLTRVDIVLGKYFAALTVFAGTLAVTGIYVAILATYGFPNMAGIVGSYIGFFLLGAALIAVCSFTAVFSESQVTAAVSSFGALFILVMAGAFGRSLKLPVVSELLTALSVTRQYDQLTRGIFTAGPVCYYISFAAVFLYLTVKALELRSCN